jgi:hypothetical protein
MSYDSYESTSVGIRGLLLGLLLLLIAVAGIGLIAQGTDFFLYKAFAPRYEAVRRQTFEESKAFNEGMAQELFQYQRDYQLASPAQRDGLRQIILHRFADYDRSKLKSTQQDFLNQLDKENLR